MLKIIENYNGNKECIYENILEYSDWLTVRSQSLLRMLEINSDFSFYLKSLKQAYTTIVKIFVLHSKQLTEKWFYRFYFNFYGTVLFKQKRLSQWNQDNKAMLNVKYKLLKQSLVFIISIRQHFLTVLRRFRVKK